MELRHLSFFLAAAEELHLARAAEKLQFLDKPAVSGYGIVQPSSVLESW